MKYDKWGSIQDLIIMSVKLYLNAVCTFPKSDWPSIGFSCLWA